MVAVRQDSMFDEITDIEETTKLTPRHYQLEGIEFLKEKKRALLYDEPGMGKTLQAAMASERPVLVACPTYLVEQWADFIKRQFPDDKVVYVFEGTQAQRLKELNKYGNVQPDWTIVNIEMLRSYKFSPVQTFIIDESHHVRNRDAQQSKKALEIATVTPRVYLLTASPIYKEADDLFFQLRIIAPVVFTSYHRFVNQYMLFLNNPWRNKIVGINDLPGLKRTLDRYALGRTYSQVGLEIPNLIEQKIEIKMNPNLAKLYREMRNEYRMLTLTFANAGALLHALRMVTACTQKTQALKELVEDNYRNRVVVFCWYVESAKAVAKILRAPAITGEIDTAERIAIAKSDHPVIVATMASLSEGVDLSRYKTVAFYEEDYTPGMVYQALSRIRRNSADNSPVRLYYLMMRNTVDEVVHSMRTNRNATAKQVLEKALKGR